MTNCIRCLYLGITQPIARLRCLCRWCLSMGREDDRLRALKGMKVWGQWT